MRSRLPKTLPPRFRKAATIVAVDAGRKVETNWDRNRRFRISAKG